MINIVFIIIITFASTAYALKPGVKHYQNPTPSPDFLLYDTENNIHTKDDYRGKVIVINFWATWCVPCREEIPSLHNAWKIFNTADIKLLAIATKDYKHDVMQFQKESNIRFPLLLDESGIVADKWRVIAVPTAFVIDKNGYIAMRIVGGEEWSNPELLESIIALK